MKLSIVTTAYLSSATLAAFCQRVFAASASITHDVELVVVNDGSPDNSRDIALALQASDPRIVIVDLARNFGHHRAMMTGLSFATGDLIFLIDCDLEEGPEDLTAFHRRMIESGCDVVYGVQDIRRGGFAEKASGYLFFSITNALSDHPIPRNLVTARLMTKHYVSALIRHRDREFAISYLWAITGFHQLPLTIKKLSLSPSTYSFWKRLRMATQYITTTSTRLLYLVLYTGLIIFASSAFIILFYFVRYFAADIGIDGYTSLIVSIWFFGGLTTLILGILGIYIANVMSESKRRPYTTVRKVHRFNDADQHLVERNTVGAIVERERSVHSKPVQS